MFIEVKNLSKSYKISKEIKVPAVNNLSFSIKKQEFVALVGPSGSGKTTLFNLLGCIDRPDSGNFFFDGQEVTTLKEGELYQFRQKKFGYIFQFFNLIPTLTIWENAELVFWNAGTKEKKIKKEKLRYILNELNIYDFRNRYPSKVSGGQRQRAAIARALANQPQLVLADEPTGNLDSVTTKKIMKLLKQECQENKVTFIVATHDHSIISDFQKIISLEDGMIPKSIQL